MCPVNTSSAARPASVAQISSSICSFVVMLRSSGRYHAAPRACPRGTMVTFTSGLAYCSSHDTEAWPASWIAMLRFSSAVITFEVFSSPPMMRSTASRKSCLPTWLRLWRAAMSAASLHTLAMSAPEKPGVCRASISTSRSSASLSGARCTLKIATRSESSGKSTWIWRSKRPARSKAGSRISTRLVAARIITPEFVPKPSISVSSWLSVFSRSSLPPRAGFLPRARPMASISSINIIQGDFSLAWLKRSRTRLAPTPTNISTKSDPDMEKKGTSASPATAFAKRVLPVPGGPTSSAPLGILPPSSVYFLGFLRKSTISRTSCLAPSCPATSLKVTLVPCPFLSKSLALLLPTLNTPPPAPPPMRRIMKNHRNTSSMMGRKLLSRRRKKLSLSRYFTLPLKFSAR